MQPRHAADLELRQHTPISLALGTARASHHERLRHLNILIVQLLIHLRLFERIHRLHTLGQPSDQTVTAP